MPGPAQGRVAPIEKAKPINKMADKSPVPKTGAPSMKASTVGMVQMYESWPTKVLPCFGAFIAAQSPNKPPTSPPTAMPKMEQLAVVAAIESL
mmetsp:Transcript_26460/g.50721  ORF Transcript_26460/g.50721 Transcript_26460/m.50721 type:complete len:93 (-) Transcript_26460:287-565(-)